ncbi:MAG: hypothetical protein PF689_10450 [Deltaproteobacteria bacterium]|jgi:hypothetical protein|nr:hypothetical protein [Deltaproteobacteria bacterium]
MQINYNLLTPLSPQELGTKVNSILEKNSAKINSAFARGVLPGLEPGQLINGIYQLALNNNEFRDTVENTISEFPKKMILNLLSGELSGEVLHYLSFFPFETGLLKLIVSHDNVENKTLAKMASHQNEEIVLIIADNHRRLIKAPDIIEKLYLNEITPMSTANKIIELAARHKLELNLEAYYEMIKAIESEIDEEEDPIDAELKAVEQDHKFKNAEKEIIEEDQEDEDELDLSRPVRISQLPVTAKIRLAQVGNRFQRAKLIRDGSKMVYMAVIKSPRITDREIEEYSKNKQMPEDIIRFIASKKEWIKSYRIKLNLVHNPKTPITISLNLLNSIRAHDLKSLARSRNIPQVIRQAADRRLKKK